MFILALGHGYGFATDDFYQGKAFSHQGLEVAGRDLGVVGFGAALKYLMNIGMDEVRAHELDLTQYTLDRLGDTPGVEIFGPPEVKARGGVVSFSLEGVHPHDIGQVLDDYGVAIRAGHHCAQPVMAALKVPATARASFYIYNTRDEVDTLVNAVEETSRIFGNRS